MVGTWVPGAKEGMSWFLSEKSGRMREQLVPLQSVEVWEVSLFYLGFFHFHSKSVQWQTDMLFIHRVEHGDA